MKQTYLQLSNQLYSYYRRMYNCLREINYVNPKITNLFAEYNTILGDCILALREIDSIMNGSKETPIKLTYGKYTRAVRCPNCLRSFAVKREEHYSYCPDCGQKLKWSEETN